MLYIFFFFYVIFALVYLLQGYVNSNASLIRTSRFFFFIRYEKNYQYNAAFEEDTQNKALVTIS